MDDELIVSHTYSYYDIGSSRSLSSAFVLAFSFRISEEQLSQLYQSNKFCYIFIINKFDKSECYLSYFSPKFLVSSLVVRWGVNIKLRLPESHA